ncbi:hypothetical protein ERD95_21840 [Enterobacteriaceae bacterium ML5]|nr:hypothetical protein ERD95_21840 [Enterobacteriaceae bacterium ML5]
MTDTTDIAVLYATAMRAKETGTSFVIPAETAISMLKHIGVLRDNLEAERQRAADLVLHVNTQANMREKAEEELAALKGDQVPVAYLIHEKAKPARLSFQNLKGFVSQSDIEEHELWQEELFTAPQKPVGLRQIGSIDHDGGEFAEYFVEFTDSAQVGQAVYVIDSAIEAAGGKVAE